MSQITGRLFGEGFGLRVVSGMLHGGNLIISWATGERSAGQLDYGYDASVPYRTPLEYLQPGEPGFDPEEPVPLYERYHYRAFPTTYIDTEHFFRVRATNPAGRTLVSAIYSVYVPEKMLLQSRAGAVSVRVQAVSPGHHSAKAGVPAAVLDAASTQSHASESFSLSGAAAAKDVAEAAAAEGQTTTIGTAPILTIT